MQAPLPKHVTFYIAITCLIFLFSCNLSDDAKQLPGGHTYVNEGRCYKYILVNIKGVSDIESCVSEYKCDDDYVTVAQIDEQKCIQSAIISKTDKKFFIIDNKKEQLLGPFSHTDFKTTFETLRINKNLFLE